MHVINTFAPQVDADGEYAGFKLSGHMLRNESILNRLDPEYDFLPHVFTQPLAVIQVRPWRGSGLHLCDHPCFALIRMYTHLYSSL